jgi:rhodanese-related sulfurtransferase
MNLETIIKNQKTVIVDVRTPSEFQGGHVADSINIPLQELTARIDEIKNLEAENIVLCCASGNRSGMATSMLNQSGFKNVMNGGSWMDVNYYKNN